jgi:hypothetical protein
VLEIRDLSTPEVYAKVFLALLRPAKNSISLDNIIVEAKEKEEKKKQKLLSLPPVLDNGEQIK